MKRRKGWARVPPNDQSRPKTYGCIDVNVECMEQSLMVGAEKIRRQLTPGSRLTTLYMSAANVARWAGVCSEWDKEGDVLWFSSPGVHARVLPLDVGDSIAMMGVEKA